MLKRFVLIIWLLTILTVLMIIATNFSIFTELTSFARVSIKKRIAGQKVGEIRLNFNNEELILQEYERMTTPNDAKISFHDNCVKGLAESSSTNASFTVVTNFFYVNPANVQNLRVGYGLKVDDKTVKWRNMEIVDTLVSNLKHPCIDEIHILVHKSEEADYLRHLPLENSFKIVIQVMNHAVEMKMQLEYAGRCLQDKVVAISHQDNLFGDGWGNLSRGVLQGRPLMYALTRHSSRKPCRGTKDVANCDVGSRYIGSHDVFVFHVSHNFTSEMLRPLDDVTPNLNGMENVLIWMFQKHFNYTVLNPCPVLIVHHQHCISVREKKRKRINRKETTGWVPFSQQLE